MDVNLEFNRMPKDRVSNEDRLEGATSWRSDSRTINNHHNQPQFSQHPQLQPQKYDAEGTLMIVAPTAISSSPPTPSIAVAMLTTASTNVLLMNKVSATGLIAHNQQNETSSNSDQQQQQSQDIGNSISDLIVQYVCISFSLVRKMIAQNLVEFLFICVIITYLIYYFSQISRRPKLIGNSRSHFVKLMNKSLAKTLNRRFSPLIYFWGTNPQTALFGYLQGKSGLHEMPRSAFKRQYLYVSDAQYLMSNVDLSEHYEKAKRQYPLQLQVSAEQQRNGLLNQNIRLALDELLAKGNSSSVNKIAADQQLATLESRESIGNKTARSIQQVNVRQLTGRIHSSKKSDRLFRGSSSGSSSDSGVFAGHSSSSSSSSTSSLAAPGDPSEDLNSPAQSRREDDSQADDQTGTLCACKLRYESQPLPLERSSSTSSQDSSVSSHNLFGKNSYLSTELDKGEEHQQESRTVSEQLEFGQCALDWHRESHIHYHSNKLVALISAGMTTGSDKKYVTDTVRTLEKLGYEVCVFIRRGVDGLKLSSTRFFSPAKWRDFEAAVQSVRHQRPDAKIVAVGFSFGSIELCRYLSMSGNRSLIHAALLISCPFDPEAGGRNMRKRLLNRRIDAYLAKNLGKQLHRALFASISDVNDAHKRGDLPITDEQQQQYNNLNGSRIDLNALPKIKSLVDFEDNFNRVIQNYPNSEAYAEDSRLQDHLALIETPTLCLSSEDDFMAPLKLLPLDQIKANKNLCMLLTKRGGHMAFIDGLIWPKKPYFAQRIIVSYLTALQSSSFVQANKSSTNLHSHHYQLAQRDNDDIQHPQDKSKFAKLHQSLLQMVIAH